MAAQQTNPAVARNIRRLREQTGLTQEAVAQFLGTGREQIAYYEAGSRSIPSALLSKLASLFCMHEYDFYEEDDAACTVHMAFAFRADEIQAADLESIAAFKKIVRNHLDMTKALSHD